MDLPKTENSRLHSLIEFAQQSAILKINPPKDVSSHGIFHEHESTLQDLPGLHFNSGGDDDEIWLTVDRLQETPPPQSENELFNLWLDISNNPTKEPVLKNAIELGKLISNNFIKQEKNELTEVNKLILLSDFEEAKELKSELEKYIQKKWLPWSVEEKKRRATIQLYGRLFMLKQHLEGAIIDTQIEVAWGVGVSVWNMQGVRVCYPLITRLVEIKTNPLNMAIEIRPRDIEPRLELDIYTAADNQGTPDLEKFYKNFITDATQTFSPYDKNTFDPVLRMAAACLDSKGIYWPSKTSSDDRKVPPPSEELKITDTWVIVARPRSKSIFVQDLERFKKSLEDSTNDIQLPNAILALVSEPSKTNQIIELPDFRGMSITSEGRSEGKEKPKDLYFPLAFNEEQVRIVQMLEKYDGVVVQGPPGTGKTHTIANIISHYFALGKRVLVTSMKEPALAVLRDKLPEEIRHLAISLLSNEQDGMKQFEHAISKISSEIQSMNPALLKKEITELENLLDVLHAQLARTDRRISDWAKKNSSPFIMDGNTIIPIEAAKEVVDGFGKYEWLDDKLDLNSIPQFDNNDIANLRNSRNNVGNDLEYIDCKLPEIVAFPSLEKLIETHQDLSNFAEIEDSISSGKIPALSDTSEQTFDALLSLSEKIKYYESLDEELKSSEMNWVNQARNYLNNKSETFEDFLKIFDSLSIEIKEAVSKRNVFVSKPVIIPENAESDEDYLKAIDNKVSNKSPFGISGFIGKSVAKKYLEETLIVGKSPSNIEDWQHIQAFVNLNRKFRELLIRWNSIVNELAVDSLDASSPLSILNAIKFHDLHLKIRSHIEAELFIQKEAQKLLPEWKDYSAIGKNPDALGILKSHSEKHIKRKRLGKSWSDKEAINKLLSRYSGKIVEDIKDFIAQNQGNKNVSDSDFQLKWSKLLSELNRLNSLRSSFENIKDVCSKIEKSDAIKWAKKLKTLPASVGDGLIPDNWQESWKLVRLSNFLDSVDGRSELKELSSVRRQTELDLSKTYRLIINKKTSLKLWENATNDIRAALVAFGSAIRAIGKGTGKKAIRYRQDARNAATRANKAIPCWIMPHWRVSESLPADFGCFDLVIIDEASQSDLSALPALLRANKVLIVGDDKQVSPDAVALEVEKVDNLRRRFLTNQVADYRAQITPERSIYDLFKVVFAHSSTMLKEHFRCIGPIIEYSKREFYNHELKPIRLPLSSERLDPPLIDVLVEDGLRQDDINTAEARYIVDEIKRICANPSLSRRTIGIISLLADKQALKIWQMLEAELQPEEIERHQIACGDARTFQGKERDIMFLSMVVSKGQSMAQTKEATEQRFNVAASRARDRMYLVRSIEIEELSASDRLRKNLISHFTSPYGQDQQKVENLRLLCESDFERELYDILTERGYKVTPQVKVGPYRIDMVVEGHNDARMAVECDGDRYHGEDKWEDDMNRQRILERAGWQFWRSFASNFIRNKSEVIEDLIFQLSQRGIEPIGVDTLPRSIHTETRRVTAFPVNDNEANLEMDVITNENAL